MSQNHESWRELCRSRASELLNKNQTIQNLYVNQQRHPPRVFKINELVFAIKYTQSTGKLDSGMRGPYRVIKVLPSNRYQLKLLSGSYGKTTQAAEYMVPRSGENGVLSLVLIFFAYDDECDPLAELSSTNHDPDTEFSNSSENTVAASN